MLAANAKKSNKRARWGQLREVISIARIKYLKICNSNLTYLKFRELCKQFLPSKHPLLSAFGLRKRGSLKNNQFSPIVCWLAFSAFFPGCLSIRSE
jgi:hypothetical protein